MIKAVWCSAQNCAIFVILMMLSVNNPIKRSICAHLLEKTKHRKIWKQTEKQTTPSIRPLKSWSSNRHTGGCMDACKRTLTAPWANHHGGGHVGKEEGATGWHTDFSWVAGDGNSISKTSRRLCKTLESGFLPADHRQLFHTLINHMQMSGQRHWGGRVAGFHQRSSTRGKRKNSCAERDFLKVRVMQDGKFKSSGEIRLKTSRHHLVFVSPWLFSEDLNWVFFFFFFSCCCWKCCWMQR